MKKILNIGFPLLIIQLASCSSEKDSKLFFSNNIESSYVWDEHPPSSIVKFDKAHSGNYVCKMDVNNPFSITYNMRVKDISPKPLSKVKVSAWFMLTENNSEQNLIINILDSSMQKSFEWLARNAAEDIKELNQWGRVEQTIDLTQKNRNNPDNVIRIYAANGRGEPVYVDDIEIQFEE